MSREYETLRDCIDKRMGMSDVCHPVTLNALIEACGRANRSDCSGKIVAHAPFH